MSIQELRSTDEATRFLQQGLWLQRVQPPSAATVRPALEWTLELASAGDPLPPVGVVADVGHVALGADREIHPARESLTIPGWPAGLARTYEDHVLGKFYADWSLERSADALRRYKGRDQARGLAFLLNQIRQRAGFGGVHFSPAVIKAVLDRPPEETLNRGWESLSRGGLLPFLADLYEETITAVRNLGEVLGPEDVFELEHGHVLAPFSQRVALRQVVQAMAALAAQLPRHRMRPRAHRQEVPTRVLDEDTYPVGGFSSLSTRGSVESLLHSQLAYMEPNDRPDLFDIKFLRDELLYYSRDENQFLRRRRTFVFALFPDLVQTRFKDPDLPWQRIVLLLALLMAAVRKLTEWLSTDALLFEFVFLSSGQASPLATEQALLERGLSEPIANGTVTLTQMPVDRLGPHCALRARRSLCHCLTLATTDQRLDVEGTVVTRLRLDGPLPALAVNDEALQYPEAEVPMTGWATALENLLPLWV
jgi:hypothetical protein